MASQGYIVISIDSRVSISNLSFYSFPRFYFLYIEVRGRSHLRKSPLQQGSHNRGVAFESHIRHRMGQVELADQVEVMSWLGSVAGYLDLDRVAVHGWSYGGYLSLMALAQYPKLFKVCVQIRRLDCCPRILFFCQSASLSHFLSVSGRDSRGAGVELVGLRHRLHREVHGITGDQRQRLSTRLGAELRQRLSRRVRISRSVVETDQ